MAEIYQLPDNGSGNASLPLSIPIGGNGGMFGNGQTNLMDLFGFAIVASMFPNIFGGRFGQGGQMGGMNSDLVMQAVLSQGDASRSAVQTLASSVGQDFNIINGAVMNVQNALQTLALQQAVSVPQIINSIQSGNSALAGQLAQCCCENRLATCQQTNELQNTINANGQRNIDAIADLKATMIQSFCDVKEREMQSKIDTQADIITQLRNAADNANQTNQIIGYVNSVVAPLQKSVTEIENKIPNTVPVQWPQLTAVNTTPYVSGGFYGGYGYGNGWGGNVVF